MKRKESKLFRSFRFKQEKRPVSAVLPDDGSIREGLVAFHAHAPLPAGRVIAARPIHGIPYAHFRVFDVTVTCSPMALANTGAKI